jgi:hypothetical protein
LQDNAALISPIIMEPQDHLLKTKRFVVPHRTSFATATKVSRGLWPMGGSGSSNRDYR